MEELRLLDILSTGMTRQQRIVVEVAQRGLHISLTFPVGEGGGGGMLGSADCVPALGNV